MTAMRTHLIQAVKTALREARAIREGQRATAYPRGINLDRMYWACIKSAAYHRVQLRSTQQ